MQGPPQCRGVRGLRALICVAQQFFRPVDKPLNAHPSGVLFCLTPISNRASGLVGRHIERQRRSIWVGHNAREARQLNAGHVVGGIGPEVAGCLKSTLQMCTLDGRERGVHAIERGARREVGNGAELLVRELNLGGGHRPFCRALRLRH